METGEDLVIWKIWETYGRLEFALQQVTLRGLIQNLSIASNVHVN